MSLIESRWVDSSILKTSQVNAANGVAGLDASSKILVAQLPTSAMEFKGAWNATTNSPTLADGAGDNGDVYRVSVAGTQNLGSGSIVFSIGDLVIYNGTIWQLAPSDSSFTGKDTDDLAEGSTNLYFTEARVLGTDLLGFTDAVATSVVAADTILQGVGKLQGQINALTGVTFAEEVFTLVAGDITNQYVTLANTPILASMIVVPVGGPVQQVTADYTMTGAQLNFQGDLASTLVATDVLIVKYAY